MSDELTIDREEYEELLAMETDAQRYRWLRDRGLAGNWGVSRGRGAFGEDWLSAATLDLNIDDMLRLEAATTIPCAADQPSPPAPAPEFPDDSCAVQGHAWIVSETVENGRRVTLCKICGVAFQPDDALKPVKKYTRLDGQGGEL